MLFMNEKTYEVNELRVTLFNTLRALNDTFVLSLPSHYIDFLEFLKLQVILEKNLKICFEQYWILLLLIIVEYLLYM